MSTRDGKTFPVIWALVDLTGSARAATFETQAKRYSDKYPALADLKASINVSLDGTRGLVKICGASAGDLAEMPTALRDRVLRVFTAKDHAEAVALVTSEEWAGRSDEL